MTKYLPMMIVGFLMVGCDSSNIEDKEKDSHDFGETASSDDDTSATDPSESDDTDKSPPSDEDDTATASDEKDEPKQSPIEFVLVNNTDETKFITIDDYQNTPDERLKRMRLEQETDGEWQGVGVYYHNLCKEIEKGERCTYVGDYWPIAQAIEPGESLSIIWSGLTYIRENTYCDDGGLEGCYRTENPTPGKYRLSLNIGDGCEPSNPDGVCYPSDEGMASATGEETYNFEFDVPCSEPRLTFNIN